MDYYFCFVIYGIVVGDVILIEEIGVIGVKEFYCFLGIFFEVLVEFVCEMKIVVMGFFIGVDVEEVGIYFDYVVGVFV